MLCVHLPWAGESEQRWGLSVCRNSGGQPASLCEVLQLEQNLLLFCPLKSSPCSARSLMQFLDVAVLIFLMQRFEGETFTECNLGQGL